MRPRWRLAFLGWFCVGVIAVGVQDCAPSVQVMVSERWWFWGNCGRGCVFVHPRCGLGFPGRCDAGAISVGGAVMCALGVGRAFLGRVVPG